MYINMYFTFYNINFGSFAIFRIKVRGHNVFWATDQHVPSWVKTLNQHDLLQEMTTRINGVIGHTKGT